MQSRNRGAGTGGIGGDPPDRKPSDTSQQTSAPSGEVEAMSLSAIVVSMFRRVFQNIFASTGVNTTPNLQQGVPTPAISVLSPSVRYYTVFVGCEVGVFESW